jgi:RNA polymerase sigma factor for flagellar operon FliA
MGKKNEPNSVRIKNLWNQYETDKSSFQDLVIAYSDLVEKTAFSISKNLPNYVDLDDLIADGYIGLMDAIRKYDSSYGFKFETYASFRIRGEILDKLRQFDWAPRSLRSKNREIDSAIEKLSTELGREPTDFEIANLLGWDISDISKIQSYGQSAAVLNINDAVNSRGELFKLSDILADKNYDFEILDSGDLEMLKAKIFSAFKYLNSQQKTVFFLHYIENLSLKDISSVLDVTESRVCQIHTGALSSIWKFCVPNFDL